MSPAKKPTKKTDKKKQGKEKDRPLSEGELRKVSGGAGPINSGKSPPRPVEPING